MLALVRPNQFSHLLRSRRRRIAWQCMLFIWLWMNAQLALASHDCNLKPISLPPSIQHSEGMIHSVIPQPGHTLTSEPICDKHCVPDSVQHDNQHAPLIALPNSARLSLIDRHEPPQLHTVAWLMPPIAGPPAEEKFCRYRE